MPLHRVVVRVPNPERQHQQRENREQMNGTPGSPLPDLVNEKRADADDQHQRDPELADRAVWNRAFGKNKLNEAERERAHRREGMRLNDRTGI